MKIRMINVDDFLKKMKRTNRYFDVKFDIEEMPSIDAVPIAQCMETKEKILSLMDDLIAEYRSVSEGGKIDAMETAKHLIDKAFTELCADHAEEERETNDMI